MTRDGVISEDGDDGDDDDQASDDGSSYSSPSIISCSHIRDHRQSDATRGTTGQKRRT